MNFLNDNHEKRYSELIKRGKVQDWDIERKSLFFIISGNEDLFKKIDYIYDFSEDAIKLECLENGDMYFCSSSRSLIELAFNLFNGHGQRNVSEIFKYLDRNNKNLALNAIEMRFF